jgi:hypothetical protein
LTLTILLVAASSLRAADWLEIKDFGKLTQRAAVTVENPGDAPVQAALVHLPLADIQKVLPDAKDGQLCVADPARKTEPKRDRANEYFVPFQVSNDTLIFAVPLKPGEKKQLFIYTAPEHLNMPAFPPKTAWDNRFAYRSFENNLVAYRMETGPGANTTGLGIDAFGKTEKGKGLRLVEAYEHGHDSYHKLAYWGVDILKCGYGPAIGGAYVFDGDKSGRPAFATTNVDCVYTGPVETLVKCTAPIEVNGKKVMATRMLTLVGDDRSIRDNLTITGDVSDSMQIGIGIRDLPTPNWIEKKDAGYAISAGDSNQPESGYTTCAISAVLPRTSYERIVEVSDTKAKPGFGDAGHVYVLNRQKNNDGALFAQNRLTIIWNGDGEVSTPEQLEKACQRWAGERDHPIQFELAATSDKH